MLHSPMRFPSCPPTYAPLDYPPHTRCAQAGFMNENFDNLLTEDQLCETLLATHLES